MNIYYACEGDMTFDKLSKIIDKYDIPKNVILISDSGWECGPTDMCGMRYSKEDNTIIFTQDNGYSTYPTVFWNTKYYYNGHLCQNLTIDEQKEGM